MKKFIVLLLLLLAGAAAWFFLSGPDGKEYVYRSVPLESGDITSAVTATGRLGAETVVEVGTQVSGTVKEIYADFNEPVKGAAHRPHRPGSAEGTP